MEYDYTLIRVARPNALWNFQIFEALDCNTILSEGPIEVFYVYWITTGSIKVIPELSNPIREIQFWKIMIMLESGNC